MPSIISTKTSGGGGIAVTGDTSGVLQLASNNGTTAIEIDASQVFKFNSGYGSVATAYGCRAWVNFNGTGTVAIRASGNVSSITDNGTGLYTVNFSTAMPDTNYSVSGTTQNVNSMSVQIHGTYNGAATTFTTSALIICTSQSTALYDCTNVCVAIFR
jgi:hypothetical protein